MRSLHGGSKQIAHRLFAVKGHQKQLFVRVVKAALETGLIAHIAQDILVQGILGHGSLMLEESVSQLMADLAALRSTVTDDKICRVFHDGILLSVTINIIVT